MNIAVVNLKDLIKYAICIVLVMCILIIGINNIKKEEFTEKIEKQESFLYSLIDSSFLYCLKTELPIMDNNTKININSLQEISNKVFSSQLAIMYNIKEIEENDNAEDENLSNDEINNIDGIFTEEEVFTEEILENVQTQVINQNNINAKYTNTANLVKINNQTSYDLNSLLENSNYEVRNKQKVIIYHTHTCESYTPSANNNYEMTGTYRTTNLNYTVSRVGDELEKYLNEYGKTIIHDKTYHDYPAYNGSYGRSLKTMENVLKSNDDAEIMIDLHRDAIGSSNTYGPKVKIGDDICAQVMFVIGSDGSGLFHPNWRENLNFAIKVQQKAEEMYPRTF